MSAPLTSAGGSLEIVLSRLESVKAYGRGYRARCPACGGKSQKLSITEADEGRVLLHCFAGCAAAAVVEALGLQLADLFPDRLSPQTPQERREAQRRIRECGWGAALDVVVFESTVIAIAARQLADFEPLSAEDYQRLMLASRRVSRAQEVLRASRPAWRPHAR